MKSGWTVGKCRKKTFKDGGLKMENQIYTLADLEHIFPFGRSKLLKLCQTHALPVIKIGKDYISSPELISRWLLENDGKEILF